MKLAERGLLDLGPMELARCSSGGGLDCGVGAFHCKSEQAVVNIIIDFFPSQSR